jgi:hypothetical protein
VRAGGEFGWSTPQYEARGRILSLVMEPKN